MGFAQTRDPATADALFREARALLKKGEYAAACPKLADSHRLDPAPGTAINLGDCLEKLGKLADALQAQRDALDMLQPGDRRIEPLKVQIATLEKRVPRLTVQLAPGAPGGAKVLRDGIELGAGSLGVSLPVNPGEHSIAVTAPGHSRRIYSTTLREGEARDIAVDVGTLEKRDDVAAEGAQPPPRGRISTGSAPVESSGGSGTRTAAYVFGIFGLAAGVFGGVAFVEANRHEGFSTSKDDGEHDLALKWQTAGIVSLVAGGAGIATGAILLFSAPERSTPDSALRVAPVIGRAVAGCVVEGSW